ncbi:MAG: NAD(P)/FAD-dependent oxidoreductase [Betaproteobacteria bacterium]|jgi:cation diffusion facilitator CzcD-associated flavoprotein CzcO|nr:NAD(P)/FAD-dependent oxidoreductase [Betaproteobacteria bacterium]
MNATATPSSPTPLSPVPLQLIASQRNQLALQALTQQARVDLERLNVPPANWVNPHISPDGQPVLDVLIAGGGMCGQTVAQALMRDGIRNIQAIDQAAYGQEGPWDTYARMLTLRSPKHLTGPDLGVPSMTFRAWYEAQHGEGEQSHFHPATPGWTGLHKVGRLDWRDYLLWVRDVMNLPIANQTRLLEVSDLPGEGDSTLISAKVQDASGQRTLLCRKLVLALGRDGSGAPRWPSFPSLNALQAQGHSRVFHSADPINFDALKGLHIGVLGAGASAFDNAACALEAGAKVTQFCRRDQLPQVNKSKWTAFPGCLAGFEALDDERKWQIYSYIFSEQVPPPWETVRRCDAHASFELRLGETWLDVHARDDGVKAISPQETYSFDAIIFATGFDVDLLERPEMARYSAHIDTWAKHVGPDKATACTEAAGFPYLGHGFELKSADGEHAKALANIHLFNWGSTLSHGAVAGDIPGLATGARRLSQALLQHFFVTDANAHWQALQAHSEAELLNTRWFASE